MGHIHKGMPSKAAGCATPVLARSATTSDTLRKPAGRRPRAVAKHEEPIDRREQSRAIATREKFLAGQNDFFYADEEQESLEAEAEIARLLGGA